MVGSWVASYLLLHKTYVLSIFFIRLDYVHKLKKEKKIHTYIYIYIYHRIKREVLCFGDQYSLAIMTEVFSPGFPTGILSNWRVVCKSFLILHHTHTHSLYITSLWCCQWVMMLTIILHAGVTLAQNLTGPSHLPLFHEYRLQPLQINTGKYKQGICSEDFKTPIIQKPFLKSHEIGKLNTIYPNSTFFSCTLFRQDNIKTNSWLILYQLPSSSSSFSYLINTTNPLCS